MTANHHSTSRILVFVLLFIFIFVYLSFNVKETINSGAFVVSMLRSQVNIRTNREGR